MQPKKKIQLISNIGQKYQIHYTSSTLKQTSNLAYQG